MKRFLISLFCILAMISISACGSTDGVTVEMDSELSVVSSTTSKGTGDVDDAKLHSSDTETKISSNEECSMKLLINEKEIPVIWENNDSVTEIMEETFKGDITVSMSMYSDNEQVGSLGKSYTRNDKQTTTHNGDIVLYSGSNIVLFYGSNSWAYTRLGKMDLSEAEVTELLSNGDVSVRLTSTRNLYANNRAQVIKKQLPIIDNCNYDLQTGFRQLN